MRLDPPSAKATREKIVGALRRMPSLVIELKPLWVYAWRERLMREGFDRATFADLDVVWGDVKPWADASRGYDAATWSFAEGEDPMRLFARGQWFLLRLDDDAVQLRWLRCAHLSTALLRNLDLKARGGRLSLETRRSFDATHGCPTVYPEKPANRGVSAEACYSCAFFAPVVDGEAAGCGPVASRAETQPEFDGRLDVGSPRRFRRRRGPAAIRRGGSTVLRPLSVVVLPAVLSDHGLGRVWWTGAACSAARS